MPRLAALLLAAAAAVLAAAPAQAYCDPERSDLDCTTECARSARVWVDPRDPDPNETLDYLVPTCHHLTR